MIPVTFGMMVQDAIHTDSKHVGLRLSCQMRLLAKKHSPKEEVNLVALEQFSHDYQRGQRILFSATNSASLNKVVQLVQYTDLRADDCISSSFCHFTMETRAISMKPVR